LLNNPNWKPPAEVKVGVEEWRKILKGAADLIEKEGWTRYQLGWGPETGYCAVGAIQKATFGEVITSDYNNVGKKAEQHSKYWDYRLACRKLEASINKRRRWKKQIFDWNDDIKDHNGRAGKFVVTKLRKVAES